MEEFYKVLEFKDKDERDSLGKYAHPVMVEGGGLGWGGCSRPMMMTMETTIRKLELIYPGLSFAPVKLVSKRLTDIDTTNT